MTLPIVEALEKADGLIFDCDGTLVNSFPVYSKAWAAGFSLSGLTMSDVWYEERNGLSEHVLMDDFERDFNVRLDRDEVVSTMRAHYRKHLADALVEIESITSVARRLAGIMPMAVASGGSREIVTQSLEALGLTALFDVIVTFDDVLKAKPETDLFLHAANALNLPPHRCLVFEDSPQWIEAAHRAGMAVIDVTRPLR